MKKRLTYTNNEFAENYPDLMVSMNDHIMKMQKGSVKQIQLVSILKLLFALRRGELTGSKLYINSCIIMKKSFYIYVNYCIRHELIEKKKGGIRNMIYSITVKGRYILHAFERVD